MNARSRLKKVPTVVKKPSHDKRLGFMSSFHTPSRNSFFISHPSLSFFGEREKEKPNPRANKPLSCSSSSLIHGNCDAHRSLFHQVLPRLNGGRFLLSLRFQYHPTKQPLRLPHLVPRSSQLGVWWSGSDLPTTNGWNSSSFFPIDQSCLLGNDDSRINIRHK